MNKLKFNLISSVVLLVVFTLLLVGTTIAYFSDVAKTPTNVMTAGNVNISLTEAAVKPDAVGNLIEDTTRPRVSGDDLLEHNYGRIYPSQTIHKDPKVENTGSEDAWIAMKVTVHDGVGDLTKVLGYGTVDGIDIRELLKGGTFSEEDLQFGSWNGFEDVIYTDNFAMIQVPNGAESHFDFYVFYLKPFKTGEYAVLFDTLAVPSHWGNTEMQELVNLRIDIEAFAVQKFNLSGCFEAMTTAFPERFSF